MGNVLVFEILGRANWMHEWNSNPPATRFRKSNFPILKGLKRICSGDCWWFFLEWILFQLVVICRYVCCFLFKQNILQSWVQRVTLLVEFVSVRRWSKRKLGLFLVPKVNIFYLSNGFAWSTIVEVQLPRPLGKQNRNVLHAPLFSSSQLTHLALCFSGLRGDEAVMFHGEIPKNKEGQLAKWMRMAAISAHCRCWRVSQRKTPKKKTTPGPSGSIWSCLNMLDPMS